MPRRIGRYTKQEKEDLIRMFNEGLSVYKICKNLNRSQKSIRNNLIKLNLIEGSLSVHLSNIGCLATDRLSNCSIKKKLVLLYRRNIFS